MYNILGPEKVIKLALFNDPATEDSAWRTGLSTVDLAAWHCVDTEWNQICKKYIGKSYQKIIEKYGNTLNLQKSTLLFNEYKQWCCLTPYKNGKKRHIVFGNYSNSTINFREISVMSHNEIYSRPITYDNRYQQKKTCAAFFVNKGRILILPDEERVFIITFKNDASFKLALPTEFKTTFHTLIRTIFELSEDPAFWHHKFEKNGIALVHEANSDLSIDLGNKQIRYLYHKNVTTLNNANERFQYRFKHKCSCLSHHMDPECQHSYEQYYSKLLEDEQANHLKKVLLRDFAGCHVWHAIKANGKKTPSLQFWVNALGGIYTRDKNNKPVCIEHDKTNSLTNEDFTLKGLKRAAIKNSKKWHCIGYILFKPRSTLEVVRTQRNGIRLPDYFYDGNKKIAIHQRTFDLGYMHTICDADYLIVNDNLLFSFLIHDSSSNDYLILHYNTRCDHHADSILNNAKYDASYNSFAQLKAKFKSMVYQYIPSYCVMRAPEAALKKLMRYITSLKSATLPSAQNRYTKDNPLTTFAIPEVNESEYLLRYNEQWHVKPKTLLDKILYGTSSISYWKYGPPNFSYFTAACWGMLTFCFAADAAYKLSSSAWHRNFTINAAIPLFCKLAFGAATSVTSFANILSGDNVKLLWSTRLITCLLFGLGSNTPPSLLDAVFNVLPVLNLGLHIAAVNKEPQRIAFCTLYNSLPVRFHRMLKKIAPCLYEIKNHAQ